MKYDDHITYISIHKCDCLIYINTKNTNSYAILFVSMNSISWKYTEKLLKRSKVNIYPLIKNRPDNNCLTPFHPRHCTGPQLKTKPKSTISLAPTSCSSVRLTLRNTTQDIHDFQEVLTVSRNLPENVFRGRRKLRELRSGNAYLSSSARAYIAWWEWPGGVEGGGRRTNAGWRMDGNPPQRTKLTKMAVLVMIWLCSV